MNLNQDFQEFVEVFVAQEIGHTLLDDNVWMPTVTIDVSQSPAVADLARVHAVEGIGDVNTHAIRQNDSVVVGVQLTSPVQAIFAVAFSYALHRDFLKEVADAGTLVFATTDTEIAHEERPLWLSVDIDGDALRQTLMFDVE
ncbi:MAG: hypothetical protein JHC78_13770 [Ilumatobacteraceae bacterium]|nr:hypothetical protein [Ilumatobacteraceae bacterium]